LKLVIYQQIRKTSLNKPFYEFKYNDKDEIKIRKENQLNIFHFSISTNNKVFTKTFAVILNKITFI